MEKQDREKQDKYLQAVVFNGLKNLNDGFDVSTIQYFSESDFAIVLDRVEQHGIAIFGIEPWLDGQYYDCSTYEFYNTTPDDPTWYRAAFAKFKECGVKGLMYSASYQVPDELLSEQKN